MPYVEVRGRRLFYAQKRDQGLDAPTLVLIHGAGGSHLHWPRELRRLPNATVYALDLPGHGRSDGPGCDAICGYVTVLLGFLDATRADRAVLVGHSMGSAVSQMMALSHANRVAGLVLVGAGARLRVHPAILDGILSDFETAVDVITTWAWAQDAPEKLTALGRATLTETPPVITYGDFMACDSFDMMQRLGDIKVPTLVIAGTADRLTPHKYGVYLAQQIPGARLVTVEGGSHMMALEQPDVVASAISGFIKEL